MENIFYARRLSGSGHIEIGMRTPIGGVPCMELDDNGFRLLMEELVRCWNENRKPATPMPEAFREFAEQALKEKGFGD